jgi:hypothetical protein
MKDVKEKQMAKPDNVTTEKLPYSGTITKVVLREPVNIPRGVPGSTEDKLWRVGCDGVNSIHIHGSFIVICTKTCAGWVHTDQLLLMSSDLL